MKITESVYKKIYDKFPVPPPEQGGILGIKNGVICEYYHDSSNFITDRAVYEPDVDALNPKIEQWSNQGIEFAGIIHSHLSGQNSLSSGDEEYIKALFKVLPEKVKELYFPIIIPQTGELFTYVVSVQENSIHIRSDKVVIIKER